MSTPLGYNITKIRTQKGYSQRELAEMLDMHATHLSRYERNVTAPSIEVLKKISEVLGVTTDMLIYGSDDDKVKDKINDNDLLNMFNKVQKFDTQELSCVKSLLEAFIFKRELQHQLAK
jgi:transcriptional regulator with XRE-family HTH domain